MFRARERALSNLPITSAIAILVRNIHFVLIKPDFSCLFCHPWDGVALALVCTGLDIFVDARFLLVKHNGSSSVGEQVITMFAFSKTGSYPEFGLACSGMNDILLHCKKGALALREDKNRGGWWVLLRDHFHCCGCL